MTRFQFALDDVVLKLLNKTDINFIFDFLILRKMWP